MENATKRLTERQRDCLRLVGQGYTSKEIGRQIGISPVTVDNYMREALSILRVGTRAEAARMLALASDQSLMGQSQPLAQPGLQAQPSALAIGRRSWPTLMFPPLGGSRNTYDEGHKTFAILAVAILSFAGLVALTLGVAAVMWLLR